MCRKCSRRSPPPPIRIRQTLNNNNNNNNIKKKTYPSPTPLSLSLAPFSPSNPRTAAGLSSPSYSSLLALPTPAAAPTEPSPSFGHLTRHLPHFSGRPSSMQPTAPLLQPKPAPSLPLPAPSSQHRDLLPLSHSRALITHKPTRLLHLPSTHATSRPLPCSNLADTLLLSLPNPVAGSSPSSSSATHSSSHLTNSPLSLELSLFVTCSREQPRSSSSSHSAAENPPPTPSSPAHQPIPAKPEHHLLSSQASPPTCCCPSPSHTPAPNSNNQPVELLTPPFLSSQQHPKLQLTPLSPCLPELPNPTPYFTAHSQQSRTHSPLSFSLDAYNRQPSISRSVFLSQLTHRATASFPLSPFLC